MSWSDVTITKSGETILSKMMNGAKLIFTRVAVGDKTVPTEQMANQTGVFSPVNATALFSGKREVPNENGVEVGIQIRNDDVKETSRIKQIGIFAKTEHDDEVMFGIMQDEIGEEVPTHADFPQFLLEMWFTVGISRTNNINVIVAPSVYVSVEHLNSVLNNYVKMRLSPIAVYDRDPNKPQYNDGEGGGSSDVTPQNGVTLRAKKYTGVAEVSLMINDDKYDGENVVRDMEKAKKGDIILNTGV